MSHYTSTFYYSLLPLLSSVVCFYVTREPIVLFTSSFPFILCRRTKRYEAHIWSDKKQIYLGSYSISHQAARAHDIVALKVKPTTADLNFPLPDYSQVQTFLPSLSQSDLVTALRKHSKELTATHRAARNTAPFQASVGPSSPSPPTTTLSQFLHATAALPPLNFSSTPSRTPSSQTIATNASNSSAEEETGGGGGGGRGRTSARRLKRKQSRPSSSLDVHEFQDEDARDEKRRDSEQQSQSTGRGGAGPFRPPAPLPLFTSSQPKIQVFDPGLTLQPLRMNSAPIPGGGGLSSRTGSAALPPLPPPPPPPLGHFLPTTTKNPDMKSEKER